MFTRSQCVRLRRSLTACVVLLAAVMLGAACQAPTTHTATTMPVTAPAIPTVAPGKILELDGFLTVHDPVIAKDGDRYYIFSTGSRIPFICSKDMIHWEWCGRVFEENPHWIADKIPGVTDLWA